METNHVPAELAALAQWVCWGAPGKARKCPYNPRTGYPAKAGQPDTWADLATATAAVNAGHYEGVGFEFNGGGIVGVDFDHCIQGGKQNQKQFVQCAFHGSSASWKRTGKTFFQAVYTAVQALAHGKSAAA